MSLEKAYIAQYIHYYSKNKNYLGRMWIIEKIFLLLNLLKEKKCPCPEFFYIPSEASYDFKCLCKLSFKLHDAITKKGPRCQGFKSTWTCSCGKRWEEHGTVFERRREREKGGRITDDTGIMMEKMEGAENTRRTEEGKRKKEEGKMEEGRRREMQDEGNATEKRERRRMEENDIWGLQDGIKENKEVHQKQDTSFLLKKAALSTLNSKIMVENLENQSQIPLQTFKNYLLDEEPSCYLLFTTPHFYRRRVWKKDLE